MSSITLKAKRERAVLNRHPWLFDGAIAGADADAGAMVAVRSAEGAVLAWGYYNPKSQIAVRLLRWGEEPPDEAWWEAQLDGALRAREPLRALTDGLRLINAESDGLPGLIVDQYGPWLVLQSLTLGMESRKGWLAEQLMARTGARGIWERSDERVRRLEGLPEVAGPLLGEQPPVLIEMVEHGCYFPVDVRHGHKTGFYLDQRDNRALVAAWSAGKRVLNGFAYTGAFSVGALLGGATHVTSVDSSQPALELAHEAFRLNGLDPEGHEFLVGDLFEVLRGFRDEGQSFDLIVLDPPKFATTQAQVGAACRGYKDINLHAFQLLRPGGLLFTFSCSGLVSAELFQKVVFDASRDAEVEAQILRPLWQAMDHPIRLAFPEAAYLKGLMVRRMA